eukprot:m.166005 g.166005  ORF g.166005 m.166005 type:complete len:584 (+) comp12635_c0_seq1:336-2087(+)
MSVSVPDFVHNLHKVLSYRASLFMGGKCPRDKLVDVSAVVAAGPEPVTVITSVRATSGLVTGRIKLNAWATTQQEKLDTTAGVSILKNCVLCLLNGALGQRGLLMQRIQIYNIAVRCTGMTVDFSVWLPSVKSSTDEADAFYAGCVKEALARLSTEEVRQYFPLFIFKSQDERAPEPDSMVSMPMSAPAAVPHEEGEGEVVQPTDSCEMMLCTTKQKKRKGVPYCGTCRKFMEETVKWYCDIYHRHPAKEKDLFVPAVRNERYQCKHPDTPSCDCKACHSLRRFEEMYPKCEAKLDEFKRRTFMFEDREKGSDKASTRTHSSSSDRPAPKQSRGSRLTNRHSSTERGGNGTASGGGGSSRSRRSDEHDTKGAAAHRNSFDHDDVNSGRGGGNSTDVDFDARFRRDTTSGTEGGRGGTSSVAGFSPPVGSDMYPRTPERYRGQSDGGGSANGSARKRKHSLNLLPMPPVNKVRHGGQQQYDEVMSSLLPNYIFNIPPTSPSKDHSGMMMGRMPMPMSPSGLDAEALDLETDSLYKELCLEDPLTFSALENMATTAPLNTWLCSVCASWNHPSRAMCTRCASKRS